MSDAPQTPPPDHRSARFSFHVTVLGCGTSTGVPAIGCRCPVCRDLRPENQRLRSSIYLRTADGAGILVDCSSDFRQQALRAAIPRVDAVLLTHDHADHVNGLDDLRAFNFMQEGAIPIYAEPAVLAALRRRFDYCFNPAQIGGGVPKFELREVHPGEALRLHGIDILPIRIKHGILDILAYRFGGVFGYATDCSAIPEESRPALRGLEDLVLDALRPAPHATHFSLAEAIEAARDLGARRTWFTHLTCRLEYHATNGHLPAGMQLLRDGQTFEF